MTHRLLPGSGEFEAHARDRVIREMNAAGDSVADASTGDSATVPFDWLLRMKDGTCVAIEVVRAEDQEQIHHVEKQARAGSTTIVGTAEMPWESLRLAVHKKVAKSARYRRALSALCEHGRLHLAITSSLQQLHFDDGRSKMTSQVLDTALAAYDVVWLVQGERVQRFDRPSR